MSKGTVVTGASVAAVTSVSLPLLIAMSDHDLVRSVTVLTLIYAALAGHHMLVGRRIARIEAITARVARTENRVLTVLQDGRDVHHLN